MARPITQLGRLAAPAALLWLSQAGASAAPLAPNYSCAAATTVQISTQTTNPTPRRTKVITVSAHD